MQADLVAALQILDPNRNRASSAQPAQASAQALDPASDSTRLDWSL